MTIRAVSGGVLVELRVAPRSRPGLDTDGEGFVLRVAAPPVDGAATEEARRALAKILRVAPSRISLHRGARSRTKVFAVSGVEPGSVQTALERAAAQRG
jgi:uncharacterized protein YggU (UPF0235/DUF167 family)